MREFGNHGYRIAVISKVATERDLDALTDALSGGPAFVVGCETGYYLHSGN